MAIDQKTPVIVSDIGQDARWDNFEWCRLALAVGLRSCWTTPILSQAGNPLGTFAIYQREVGSPTPLQTDLIGRFTHIASIAVERAQAEEALRRSQAQLARAQRLSTTGSFSYRAATDELTLSEETCRICGFDPGKPVPPGAMRDRIHPEDLPLFLSMLGGAGRQFEFDCRVQLEDGAIKYLHVVADAVRDDAGGLVEWVGAIRDVTDRKHAEDELRQSEAFLAEAQRLSSTGSFCWRVAKGEIIWSEQTYRIYEIDPTLPVTFDLVGTRIHPEEACLVPGPAGARQQRGPRPRVRASAPDARSVRQISPRRGPCDPRPRRSVGVHRRRAGCHGTSAVGRRAEQAPIGARAHGEGHHTRRADGVDCPRSQSTALGHHHEREYVVADVGR